MAYTRKPPKTTAHALIRQMKRARVAEHLGLTPNAISAALASGKLPSRWYGPLVTLGVQEGIPVPLAAFRWIDLPQESSHGTEAIPATSR